MQLVRFLAGRFAPHHSPTREGREVFAKKGDKNVKKALGNTETQRSREAEKTEGTDTLTQHMRQNVTSVMPEVTIADLDTVYTSPEIAECADFDEGAAVTKFLKPDEAALAENGRWRRELSQQRAREIDLRLKTERENHMREFVQDPRNVARMAGDLKTRTEIIEGFSRGLELRIQTIFGIAGIKNQKIAALFAESNPNVDADEIRTMIEESSDVPVEKRNELVGLILEAQNLLRKERNAGLLYEFGDMPADHWKTHMLSLTKQLRATERLLDAQLQQQSTTLETALNDSWKKMLQQCADAQTGTELDSKFLGTFGVTYEAAKKAYFDRSLQLLRIKRDPKAIGNQRPPEPGSADFLRHANASFEKLGEIDRELASDGAFLAEERTEQRELEHWACDVGKMLREFRSRASDDNFLQKARSVLGDDGIAMVDSLHDVLEPYAEAAGETGAVERLRLDPEHRLTTTTAFDTGKGDTDWTFTSDRRYGIAATLAGVLENAEAMEKYAERLRGAENNADGDDVIAGEIEQVRSRLQTVMGQLLPNGNLTESFSHQVSETLNLPSAFQRYASDITSALATTKTKNGKSDARRQLEVQTIKIENLEKCLELSQAIEVKEVTAEQMTAMGVPPEKDGWYEYDTGIVYVRKNLTAAERREVELHERGHAIVDVVTRRSGVFPFLLTSLYHDLGKNAQLEQMATDWGIAAQRDTIIARWKKKFPADEAKALEEAEREYRHILVDELVNQHAQWRNLPPAQRESVSKSQNDRTARELFGSLEEIRTVGAPEKTETALEGPSGIRVFTEATAHDANGDRGGDHGEHNEQGAHDHEPPPEELAAPENLEGFDMKEALHNILKGVKKLDQFHAAYPNIPLEPPDMLEGFAEVYDKLNTSYVTRDPAYPPSPEQNPEFKANVKRVLDEIEKVGNAIDKIDNEKLDTSRERREGGGIWSRIRFVSISDIMKLWEDTKHDIQHIYKRRQDKNLKEFGDPLLRLLQIGKDIPIAGHYLHELHQYHERRYAGEEQKAANEWKEGLTNEDSATVLEMIHGSHNKDQVRGIIALLCSRGEMDWNDEGTWHTLAHLSGYHHSFPLAACRRNDILRDIWLRKMVTAIWKDAELYYHWRQENDSKTDSGKKGFEATVDQLANVSGGMSAELEKQLKLWITWKNAPSDIRGKQPEDIKPHLYEEVIDYAMARGKMTMEQKFYYLVQGVATGLLSIDRLRVLAGKFLNILPFIDYFYQRNNTMPEVQALAERLQEPDPEKQFRPGIRTSLWLHYYVAREKSAQERLSKALSGARAEGIDHEDIPFFLTNVDASSVDSMTGVISGTRLKISPEGTKNAYVGWNSKFKAFGALLEAETDRYKYDRVSASDVNMLAQTLIGYIRFDNIATRNVTNLFAPTEKVMITENLLSSNPVSGITATKDYRQGMIGFMKELYDALGRQIQSNMDNDPLLQGKNIRVEDFLSLDVNGSLTKHSQKKAKDLYEHVTNFDNAFVKAINDNQDIFKKILRDYSKKESGVRFHNEGGSPNLRVDDAVKLIGEYKAHEAATRTGIHDDHGHGGGHH